MTINEIKKEIRRLRKSIKDFKPRTKERKEIKKQILELKGQIKALEQIKEDKKPLVEAIQKLDPTFKRLGINLYKHNKEELEYHLKKLKTKGV